MAQTVRITYYGMDGEGRNVTEAKKDAGRKIEEALHGNYTPFVLARDGVAFVAHRNPQGWGYTIFRDDESGGSSYCSDTREGTIRCMRSHAAQYFADSTPDYGASYIENAEDLHAHISLINWHRGYRAWLDAGLSKAEADAKMRKLSGSEYPPGFVMWSPIEDTTSEVL